MALESPPRLKQDPELGSALTAADAGSELGAARLAAGADAVRAAIAAGGGARPVIVWWKFAIPIVILLGVLVAVRQLAGGGEDGARAPVVIPDAAPAPIDALIAQVEVPDAAVEAAPAPPAIVDDEPRAHKPRVPPPAPPDAAPATSDLPEQIRLYEDARAAGARGELSLGLARLDELFTRFPSTQLRAEAELTRAELLTRAGRLDDAVVALDALIADPSHAGRRGELLRALGDVRRKQGDCTAAVDAYTRAQGERLSTREQAKVARGLERCAASPGAPR